MAQRIGLYCKLEFICDRIPLQFFANILNRKNMIAKNFNSYIVIMVVINVRMNFLIAIVFPSKFPAIFANIFQHKIILVYSALIY